MSDALFDAVRVPEGTIEYGRAWETIESWIGASGAPEIVVRSSLALAMHYDTLQQNYEKLLRQTGAVDV